MNFQGQIFTHPHNENLLLLYHFDNALSILFKVGQKVLVSIKDFEKLTFGGYLYGI